MTTDPPSPGSAARPPRRPTIAAVAELAGVSTSAVSHVFNGRPNVSAETALRVRAAADQLNWRPNLASRKVNGAGGGSLGLVITQSASTFQRDPFFIRLLSGLTAPLSDIGWSLSLTVVDAADEAAVYRQWWTEQRVDGFLLVDLRRDDPRVDLLERLAAPAVLLGAPSPGHSIPAVTLADDVVLDDVIEHLSSLGHRSLARVTSSAPLAHVRTRDERFVEAVTSRGLTPRLLVWHDDADDPVRDLLAERDGSTALVFDSEALATQTISHAADLGVRVPGDVSILSWEDSWVSDLVRPRLTALDAPVEDSARRAVDMIARLSRGEAVESVLVPGRRLIVRDSTDLVMPSSVAVEIDGRPRPTPPSSPEPR